MVHGGDRAALSSEVVVVGLETRGETATIAAVTMILGHPNTGAMTTGPETIQPSIPVRAVHGVRRNGTSASRPRAMRLVA